MKTDPAAPAELKPTRVRYGVLAFACALAMITYLDRFCISSAVPFLLKALELKTIEDITLALTAFNFAYAIFEIPSGWLGDVFGPRRVLIRIVLWWSTFTALTGLIGLPVAGVQLGFWSLVAIRFLFGMGEAGAFPNVTRALHNWFPLRERGLAQGAVWMAGRGMGGLTPLIWLFLVEGLSDTGVSATGVSGPKAVDDGQGVAPLLRPLLDWRMSFWLFGLLGLMWCTLFALWFRNRPDEKASVNQAERDLIETGRRGEGAVHGPVPWLALLTSRNLWALCLIYFCASYAWYFNATYLPTFLAEQHGVRAGNWLGAVYKGGPLWMGAIACLLGGFLTDAFIRRTGDLKWGRRWFGLVGHGLCAVCYLGCLAAPSALTFFLAISLAAFCNDLTMGATWATCQDIGRRYTAIVAGCMNTIGNLGGAAGTFMVGTILQKSVALYDRGHQVAIAALPNADQAAALKEAHVWGYQVNLLSFVGVYVLAVVLWFFVDASRPVVPEAAEEPAA
jgi:ACS family glucarate transporter-like MFS transporter